MLKKMISTVLVFVMMLSIIPIMDSKKSEAISKEEVPDGYTPIYDEADLAGINNNPEGKYILMNDIDLSETKKGGKLDAGNGWKPLDEFYGELDGNGHYIENMHIYGTLKASYYGLFESLSGTVKKLGMKNVNIEINNIQSENNIYAGAIAGICYDGQIEQCFVTGAVSGETEFLSDDSNFLKVGCFCGTSGQYSHIKDCYNGADITIVKDEKNFLGAFSSNGGGHITNCYNVGNIANGKGALFDDFGWSVTNCFYLQGSGVGEEQGSPLAESQMKKKQYYTKFDFDNVWEIDAYHKYQYPQLKECIQQRVKELKIEKLPSKTVYYQGDKLILTGSKINITYEDDYEITTSITDDMLGKYDMMKLGKVNIPIVKGGKTISFTVTVKPIEVSNVSLNKTKLSLNPKDEYQLSASVSPTNATNQLISWNSSNDNVATVDQRGYVKALKYGTTIITAKASNGIKAQCTIVVETPLTSIEIRHADNDQTFWNNGYQTSYDNVIILNEGQNYQCTLDKYPSNSSDTVNWQSNNSNIAQVTAGGLIQAKSMGNTTITVTAKSGVRSSVAVFVKRDISKCNADSIAEQDYSEDGCYPAIVLRDGDTVLNGEGYNRNYDIEFENNDKPGQATVRITAADSGYYYGEKIINFTIKEPVVVPTKQPVKVNDSITQKSSQQKGSATTATLQKVSKGKIKSVKNLKGKKIKVVWKKINGADGYEIEIARNRKMTKNCWSKDTSKTSVICKKRKKKKYYYVRVRAYYETEDEIIEGAWSTVKKVKVTK